MDSKAEYQRKTVSPEEAVKVIRPGDQVAFAPVEPLDLSMALMARSSELHDMKLYLPGPGRDMPWYEPGWEEAFEVTVGFVTPIAMEMMKERRGDLVITGLLTGDDPMTRGADVLFITLSPPDQHGYCGFGPSVWRKKKAVRNAKIVIAEVNEKLIRTYGDNFIHVSEVDYFVKHTPSGEPFRTGDLLGRETTGPGEVEKAIAEHVASLIKDGDTIEIGGGGASEWILHLGVLDDKNDLGLHSELCPMGTATLIKNGVITGKRKTLDPNKAVATACGGGTAEEMNFFNMNPVLELYSSGYVLNPKVISAHDNMVAVNSALAVDLTGQIVAESLGTLMVAGTGGQLAFATGANLSRGGRSIVALRSTAKRGTISRIVSQLAPGSIVTVPRTLADIVITEYGIAQLKGKTQRERANELISIAHPDFHDELKKDAKKLYWP